MTFEIEKTCCFTGHRTIPQKEWTAIENKTEEICLELIQRGIKYFMTGGALGFDTMAAQCILRLRTEYDIKLIIAVPCRTQSKNWSEADREIYRRILELADCVTVLSEEYTKECMLRRNRYMVQHSSVCVAYLKRMSGGTAYTVRYAADEGAELIFV